MGSSISCLRPKTTANPVTSHAKGVSAPCLVRVRQVALPKGIITQPISCAAAGAAGEGHHPSKAA